MVDLLTLIDMKYAVLHDVDKETAKSNSGSNLELEQESDARLEKSDSHTSEERDESLGAGNDGWSEESDINLDDADTETVNVVNSDSKLFEPLVETMEKTDNENIGLSDPLEISSEPIMSSEVIGDMDCEKDGWSEESDLDFGKDEEEIPEKQLPAMVETGFRREDSPAAPDKLEDSKLDLKNTLSEATPESQNSPIETPMDNINDNPIIIESVSHKIDLKSVDAETSCDAEVEPTGQRNLDLDKIEISKPIMQHGPDNISKTQHKAICDSSENLSEVTSEKAGWSDGSDLDLEEENLNEQKNDEDSEVTERISRESMKEKPSISDENFHETRENVEKITQKVIEDSRERSMEVMDEINDSKVIDDEDDEQGWSHGSDLELDIPDPQELIQHALIDNLRTNAEESADLDQDEDGWSKESDLDFTVDNEIGKSGTQIEENLPEESLERCSEITKENITELIKEKVIDADDDVVKTAVIEATSETDGWSEESDLDLDDEIPNESLSQKDDSTKTTLVPNIIFDESNEGKPVISEPSAEVISDKDGWSGESDVDLDNEDQDGESSKNIKDLAQSSLTYGTAAKDEIEKSIEVTSEKEGWSDESDIDLDDVEVAVAQTSDNTKLAISSEELEKLSQNIAKISDPKTLRDVANFMLENRSPNLPEVIQRLRDLGEVEAASTIVLKSRKTHSSLFTFSSIGAAFTWQQE